MLFSDLFVRLDREVHRISNTHFYFLLLGLLLFSIVKIGLGPDPAEYYWMSARDPYESSALQRNYFQGSPFLPVLAFQLGFTARIEYMLFALSLILVSFILLATVLKRRHGNHLGLIMLAIGLSHPLTTSLYSWLGLPDAFLLLLGVILLLFGDWRLIFICSFLGPITHPSAVFAIPFLLMLRAVSEEDTIGWMQGASSLLGIVLGLSSVQIFLRVHEIKVYSRIALVLEEGLGAWLEMNLGNLPYLLFSLNGALWIGILAAALLFFEKDRRYYSAYGVITLLAYAITFFAKDNTRIFGLLTWAPTVHLFLHSHRLSIARQSREVAVQYRYFLNTLALVGIAFPNFIMWKGEINPSSFHSFYQAILLRLGGGL